MEETDYPVIPVNDDDAFYAAQEVIQKAVFKRKLKAFKLMYPWETTNPITRVE